MYVKQFEIYEFSMEKGVWMMKNYCRIENGIKSTVRLKVCSVEISFVKHLSNSVTQKDFV